MHVHQRGSGPRVVLVHGSVLGGRPPDEAEPPQAALRAAGFPVLVVSGAHSEANEIICDTIARETGARRAVCRGRDHLVPEASEFKALLQSFLTSTA
ncbi:hypothetical protein GCM10027200_84110 [Lentzea nigeriaca]